MIKSHIKWKIYKCLYDRLKISDSIVTISQNNNCCYIILNIITYKVYNTITMKWEWIGPGGFLGLQIRSRVVKPAEVGSIPTRSRHNLNFAERRWLHDRSSKEKTHSNVL